MIVLLHNISHGKYGEIILMARMSTVFTTLMYTLIIYPMSFFNANENF